jgi:hypothetical protein
MTNKEKDRLARKLGYRSWAEMQWQELQSDGFDYDTPEHGGCEIARGEFCGYRADVCECGDY